MGRQSSSGIRSADSQQQPASSPKIQSEWASLQHGTIRQSIRLQKRRSDGPGKCLQDLVAGGPSSPSRAQRAKVEYTIRARPPNMKTILVTGSSGLIGSEAVEHFDRQDHRVIGVDNNMRQVFFGAQ